MPPWPCHPQEDRDPPLALDSRLRGNDDLRAWESEFCDTLLRGNDDFLREHQAGQPCRRVTVKMEL
ncbi:hypothetical protein [Endozoicomonas sp. ALD040]|uniref:hypothetical protein n=1 Tax=Endozoicomonas sp. ALD040 TaxID=3403079 RepID=UPI003BB13B4E